MTDDLEVRPPRRADLGALAEAAAETALFPIDFLAPMIEPFFSAGRGADLGPVWFMASMQGAAAGFAYAEPEPMADRVWNLRAIAVRPRAQGRGAGRALVGAVEAAASAAGGRLLLIDTSSGAAFAPARAFYGRLGYRTAARIADYWADGDDKVTFVKRLETGAAV